MKLLEPEYVKQLKQLLKIYAKSPKANAELKEAIINTGLTIKNIPSKFY